jgi:transcription termination/antitermination protein NusG
MSGSPEEMDARDDASDDETQEIHETQETQETQEQDVTPDVTQDLAEDEDVTEDVTQDAPEDVVDVPEAPEIQEPPFEPADETLAIGVGGPASEEPDQGQVEVISEEEPEPELPPTDEAIGEGPTDRVTVQVEAEEPVTIPEPEPEPEPEVETSVPDPFKGPGDWYVVHTYAGYENKVKTNLESRIHTMQMEDKIFDVHIPMEDVMEIKGGKKQVVQRKVFPGYLLVKMFYDNDSWYVVRNTPGVTGFVAAGTGSKPTPLSRREVEKILAVKKEEVKPQFRLGFEEGDVVRIISGPFADFNGTISEINVDQSKLKVLVNIFDRETPVELGFDQVAKV